MELTNMCSDGISVVLSGLAITLVQYMNPLS